MLFEFFDRQFFDILIFVVFGVGVTAAAFRLYQDFTRPLPKQKTLQDDDTQPRQ